jgi:4-carboxymuconolactone decarboxylase
MTRITKKPALAAILLGGLIDASAQDRMPPLSPDKMTDAQKKAVADYKQLRGADLTGPPWSVILRVPDLVVPSLEMRLHNQKNSALTPKLTEFAILIAARQWTNNFEWNAYATAAERAGLSKPIIAAVADGRRPDGMADDEALVYDFCVEVLHNQSVSDPTYARMLAKFGEPGAVEAASLEGYYTYLSMIMNTARSPLAPGTKPALAPFPK